MIKIRHETIIRAIRFTKERKKVTVSGLIEEPVQLGQAVDSITDVMNAENGVMELTFVVTKDPLLAHQERQKLELALVISNSYR